MALVTVHRAPSPLPVDASRPDEESERGDEERKTNFSDSFLTVKGAALFIPGGNSSVGHQFSLRCHKDAEHLQQHLQAMFSHMRPEDTIMLAAHLESVHPTRVRYMTLVSTHVSRGLEEGFIMGLDFPNKDSADCTIGLVLPLLSDTMIHLDGDGGFSVTTSDRTHIFKPVSVQAMWSALQCLYKACEQGRQRHYHPGSRYARWLASYAHKVASEQSCLNEWNVMCDLESQRPESPALFQDTPTESVCTERQIRAKLREIMAQCDLESVTSKEIRNKLEAQMGCNLKEYKGFIDNEMIIILGQMDCPSHIFDHVYLGSEWNASNLEDLKKRSIGYILNVTREIDNFFPGAFEYRNVRVYDVDSVNLRTYWNDTYTFISLAKSRGSKCLVHCKMGVSRSASTVIAYAMKEYGWTLEHAYSYVKSRRGVVKPNSGFMRQLEEYQGILDASKQRHNKLWRSHSEGDISEHATDKDMDRSFTQGTVVCDGDADHPEPAPGFDELAERQASPCPRAPSPQLLGGEGGGATLAPAPRPKSWSPDVCPPYVTPFQLIRMDSDPCASSPTAELIDARFDPGALGSEPCTPTALDAERRRAPSLSESRKNPFCFELPTIHIEDMERDALESGSDDDLQLAAEIMSWEPKPAPRGDEPADTAGESALAPDARPLSPQTPVLGPFSPVHAALQPQTASMAVKTHRGRIDFLAVMERVRSLSEEEELASPPLRPEAGRRAAGQFAGAFRPVARRVPLKRSREVGGDAELPASRWSPHEQPARSLPKQTSWKPVCGQVRRQAEMMERRSGGLDGSEEEEEEEEEAEEAAAAAPGTPRETHRPPSLSEIASHSATFQSAVDDEDVFDASVGGVGTAPAATRHHGLRHQQSIAQLQQAGLVRRTAGRWSGAGPAPDPEQEEQEEGDEGGGQDDPAPAGGERAAQEVAPQTIASRVQKLSRGESGGDGDGGGGGGDGEGRAAKPRMQHQASIMQLAEAGLVSKQAKELRKKMTSPPSPAAPGGSESPAGEEAGAPGAPGAAEPENDRRQSLPTVDEERAREAEQAGPRTEPGGESADGLRGPREEPGRPPPDAGAPRNRAASPSPPRPIADAGTTPPRERSGSDDGERRAGDATDAPVPDERAPGRGLPARSTGPARATPPRLPFLRADHGRASLSFDGETVFCKSPSEESGAPAPGGRDAAPGVASAPNAGGPSGGSGARSSEPGAADDAAPGAPEKRLSEGDDAGEEAAAQSCSDDDDDVATAAKPASRSKQQRSGSARRQQEPQQEQPGTHRHSSL